jgi:glucokinase
MVDGVFQKVNMNDMKKQMAIGIDLGCTNIKAVVVDEEGEILFEDRQETQEQNDKHWKQTIRTIIGELKFKHEISAIGLCAPGLANDENSCIAFMPGRLPGLENFCWSDFVNEKIVVLNDAHSALTAEASFGAGKGLKHAILLTLGTGVGGGILIDGKLYQGLSQMAGHLGHSSIESNSHWLDVTNMPGSIEDEIGNLTVEQRSHGKFSTTFQLIDAYKKGDTFATWLWLSSVRKLAISISSYINILSPEAVIIGGGIAQAKGALMEPLQSFLDLYEWRPGGKKTILKLAYFSDLAGAIGAAGFALSKQKSNK